MLKLLKQVFLSVAFLFLSVAPADAIEPLEFSHFEDASASLSLKEILEREGELAWKEISPAEARFGHSRSRHWFRFRLPHPETGYDVLTVFFEIPYVYLERLVLYTVENGRVVSVSMTGMAVPVSQRDADHVNAGSLNFRVKPPRKPDQVYYLSAESRYPLALPLRVKTGPEFFSVFGIQHFLIGIFFGCLAITLAFNSFLAFALRSRLYLFYSLFVASVAFLFLGHEGLSIFFVWPEWPWWAMREMHVFGALAVLFYAAFASEFFQARAVAPGLYRVLWMFVAISTIRGIWYVASPGILPSVVGEISVVGSKFTIFLLALYCFYKRFPAARFFLAASSAFLLGMILFMLQAAQVIWLGSFVNFLPHLGTGLEVILLSLALGDRIRNTNRSLIKAQEKIEEEARERVRAERDLFQAERLAALGRMAGNISHEINNPLAIIRGNAQVMRELLGRDPATSRQLLESADDIVKTTGRVSNIVKSMRALSRDASGDPFARVSVGRLLSDVALFSSERFRSQGVKLDLPGLEGLPFVRGRYSELGQVLINLLNNALDAVEGREDARIWVRVDSAGTECRISVIDSGGGIPEEIREKIFEPFYSQKSVGKGMGLGLSISRALVEAHGGKLGYESSGGRTCFYFTLPLASTEEELAPDSL